VTRVARTTFGIQELTVKTLSTRQKSYRIESLDALREGLTAYAERTRDRMKQPGELAFDVPEDLVVLAAGPRRQASSIIICAGAQACRSPDIDT
jgi:hypothetical protein